MSESFPITTEQAPPTDPQMIGFEADYGQISMAESYTQADSQIDLSAYSLAAKTDKHGNARPSDQSPVIILTEDGNNYFLNNNSIYDVTASQEKQYAVKVPIDARHIPNLGKVTIGEPLFFSGDKAIKEVLIDRGDMPEKAAREQLGDDGPVYADNGFKIIDGFLNSLPTEEQIKKHAERVAEHRKMIEEYDTPVKLTMGRHVQFEPTGFNRSRVWVVRGHNLHFTSPQAAKLETETPLLRSSHGIPIEPQPEPKLAYEPKRNEHGDIEYSKDGKVIKDKGKPILDKKGNQVWEREVPENRLRTRGPIRLLGRRAIIAVAENLEETPLKDTPGDGTLAWREQIKHATPWTRKEKKALKKRH